MQCKISKNLFVISLLNFESGCLKHSAVVFFNFIDRLTQLSISFGIFHGNKIEDGYGWLGKRVNILLFIFYHKLLSDTFVLFCKSSSEGHSKSGLSLHFLFDLDILNQSGSSPTLRFKPQTTSKERLCNTRTSILA